MKYFNNKVVNKQKKSMLNCIDFFYQLNRKCMLLSD